MGAVEVGEIVRFDATLEDMRALLERFGSGLQQRIDPGEQEALVALLHYTEADTFLISADQACVRAATLIGEGERIVSLETALRRVGLSKTVGEQYSEEWFQRWVTNARIALVQGRDLAG